MSKFGPFDIGARELARREWRERVARAAEKVGASNVVFGTKRRRIVARLWSDVVKLRAALAAPRSWTRPRAGADLGKLTGVAAFLANPAKNVRGMTIREFCRRGFGDPRILGAMDHLRRKRRAAQRRRG